MKLAQVVKHLLRATIIGAAALVAVTPTAKASGWLACTPVRLHYGSASVHFQCDETSTWFALPLAVPVDASGFGTGTVGSTSVALVANSQVAAMAALEVSNTQIFLAGQLPISISIFVSDSLASCNPLVCGVSEVPIVTALEMILF